MKKHRFKVHAIKKAFSFRHSTLFTKTKKLKPISINRGVICSGFEAPKNVRVKEWALVIRTVQSGYASSHSS